jgi:hypothetical protein
MEWELVLPTGRSGWIESKAIQETTLERQQEQLPDIIKGLTIPPDDSLEIESAMKRVSLSTCFRWL